MHIHVCFTVQKEWHPSTLRPKECYQKGNATLSSMIADLSKRANKIHEAENNDMKVGAVTFHSVHVCLYIFHSS